MKKKDNLRYAAFIVALVFVALGSAMGLLSKLLYLVAWMSSSNINDLTPAIIGTLAVLSFIHLAWTIPMIIMIKKSITSGKNHIALGVCAILFLNIVSGILILVSNTYPDENSNNIVDESLQNQQNNQL